MAACAASHLGFDAIACANLISAGLARSCRTWGAPGSVRGDVGMWGHGPKSFFCILEAVGAVAGEGQRGQSWGNTRLAGAGSSRHRALHRNTCVGALGRALWGVLCPQKGWEAGSSVLTSEGAAGSENQGVWEPNVVSSWAVTVGPVPTSRQGVPKRAREPSKFLLLRNPPSPRDVAEISECCGRIQLPSWEVASGEGSSVSWPWLHWLQVPLAIPTARPREHPGARLH